MTAPNIPNDQLQESIKRYSQQAADAVQQMKPEYRTILSKAEAAQIGYKMYEQSLHEQQVRDLMTYSKKTRQDCEEALLAHDTAYQALTTVTEKEHDNMQFDTVQELCDRLDVCPKCFDKLHKAGLIRQPDEFLPPDCPQDDYQLCPPQRNLFDPPSECSTRYVAPDSKMAAPDLAPNCSTKLPAPDSNTELSPPDNFPDQLPDWMIGPISSVNIAWAKLADQHEKMLNMVRMIMHQQTALMTQLVDRVAKDQQYCQCNDPQPDDNYPNDPVDPETNP